MNGWTFGSSFTAAGAPATPGVFNGLGSGSNIRDLEMRVGAGLELENSGAGAFFFGFGGPGTLLVLAQQFNGVGVGQTVTVDYVLDANTGMQLFYDDGSGTYANAGALDGSFDFNTTGSGNIRIAMVANNGADSNTRLSSINVSAVPEPSAALLGGLGLLALLRRRR